MPQRVLTVQSDAPLPFTSTSYRLEAVVLCSRQQAPRVPAPASAVRRASHSLSLSHISTPQLLGVRSVRASPPWAQRGAHRRLV
mmetsp:Transcript_27440/g.62062  ORF Transcript_27440/g.62062 Transcript_27440/m.62062 type:complete len:84 (+) Transcript_27440:314-565(+)